MNFKTFQTNIERSYNMNNLTHALFYDGNSINEKFKSYLNNKYKNKVDSYIKPFGFFNWKVDSITSINFRIGVHGLIGSKYKNKVSIVFEKDDNNRYVLNNNFYGIKKKSSYQILNDVIEFMDDNFQVI